MLYGRPPPALALIYFASVAAGVRWDCANVRVDGKEWDLTALGGPRSVFDVAEHPPTTKNTTFTIDLCGPLKGSECPAGTHVCGLETTIYKDGHHDLTGTIPIAGNYESYPGFELDPAVARLKSQDPATEGLSVELHGGQYPFDSANGRRQKAVIQLMCDRTRTGLEGVASEVGGRDQDDEQKTSRNATVASRSAEARGEAEAGPNDDAGQDKSGSDEALPSLQFISYGPVEEMDVLRLNWRTKYACEDYKDDTSPSSGSGAWGFFSWLIIIGFLATAAYLIFGSWLNYNRYGARGWDLLPHGDTLRDVPYILKDWARAVVSTFRDGGSRGGYSAV
ncbi:hypothetical protein KEM52_006237 [Ascosphaera acerosa]|nr:hypothetical protein KEM52_006237 [Ascosphaera acerosa]